MSRKAIAIGVSSIVILGGAWVLFAYYTKATNPASDTGRNSPQPWVEVIRNEALEIKRDNSTRILKTGDEVEIGSTIQTNPTGNVHVYFENGSVARVDANTSLVIQDMSLDKNSGTLSVKLVLIGGRVWSKIATLANFNTSWEVKTTNAVAVVRGTAFGMEFKNGTSRILGSEHTATVTPLDPETGKEIKEKGVVIEPDKFVDIKNEEIEGLKADRKLTVRTATAVILRETWVVDNEKKDLEFEKKVEEIEVQEERQSPEAIPNLDAFKIEILKRASEVEPPPPTNKPGGTITPPPSANTLKPVELLISSKIANTKLTEGERRVLSATLKMSDGSLLDVTGKARWQVLGLIGKIESPGVFVAAIDPSAAEIGEVSGAVVVTWEGDGASLLGKILFNVVPEVPTNSTIPEGS